jgi:signal peptidase II
MHLIHRTTATVVALVGLVGCDHVTKHVAKSQLQDRPPHGVIGRLLDLRYVENTDVAFNLLRWIPVGVRRPLLMVLGAVALVALIVALARALAAPGARTGTAAGLALILSGALGNYLDRLVRGYVVDFIHVPHWPVFNVADIAVAVGIGLLIWTNGRNPVRRLPDAQSAKTSNESMT